LIGLPGSGKSTLANSLVGHSQSEAWSNSTNELVDNLAKRMRRRGWIRASQDESPNRRREECEALVRNGLNGGYNVIVDRVGFDVR